MVIECIIDLTIGLVTGLLTYLPSVVLPPDILIGVASIFQLFHIVSFIVPMDVVVVAVLWWFALSNAHIAMSIINWLFRKVPTIS